MNICDEFTLIFLDKQCVFIFVRGGHPYVRTNIVIFTPDVSSGIDVKIEELYKTR